MAKKIVRCKTCKKSAVRLGASFTFLTGGTSYNSKMRSELKDASAYLAFGVHGAHSGGFNTSSAIERVIDEDNSSHFELVFCSPACLRKFLNAAVDRLEKKLRKKRR